MKSYIRFVSRSVAFFLTLENMTSNKNYYKKKFFSRNDKHMKLGWMPRKKIEHSYDKLEIASPCSAGRGRTENIRKQELVEFVTTIGWSWAVRPME